MYKSVAASSSPITTAMRRRIPDGVGDLGSRTSTTGALGDEPPSRFAIGGTSREGSVALSPSAMKWRLLATRHLPQLPLSGSRVGWAKSAAQRRRESLAHDFAHASMHIQRVGNGAPDFELAAHAPSRRLPTLLPAYLIRRRLPKIRYIRCISTTPFRKMMTRSFLALHEAAVSGQSSHRVPAVRRALG
jgi:hypothetical protein